MKYDSKTASITLIGTENGSERVETMETKEPSRKSRGAAGVSLEVVVSHFYVESKGYSCRWTTRGDNRVSHVAQALRVGERAAVWFGLQFRSSAAEGY